MIIGCFSNLALPCEPAPGGQDLDIRRPEGAFFDLNGKAKTVMWLARMARDANRR
jgi:hypothetical protein